MGTDKSLMLVDGQVQAVRATEVLRAAGLSQVVCLGGNSEILATLGLTVVPDRVQFDGPLRAITDGLAWAVENHFGGLAVIACDMPNVTVDLLDSILSRLETHDCAIAESSRGLEPLCAVYSTSCVETFNRHVAAGERAPRRVLGHIDLVKVDVGDDRLVRNVNLPGDLV